MNESFTGMKITRRGQDHPDNSFTIPLRVTDTGRPGPVQNISMQQIFTDGMPLSPWRLL